MRILSIREEAIMSKNLDKTNKKKAAPKHTKPGASAKSKAAEYIRCLMELHKMQEVLLAQLDKEIGG